MSKRFLWNGEAVEPRFLPRRSGDFMRKLYERPVKGLKSNDEDTRTDHNVKIEEIAEITAQNCSCKLKEDFSHEIF